MNHLCITYHMTRNWGTSSKPQLETAETCIVLPMNDDIAEDILLNGANSKHLSSAGLGKVYLALSHIAEIQDYQYAGFCSAEEVALSTDGQFRKEEEISERNV